ncbi:MAG: NUDIX hydrolase [Chloroflexi bacterium]|nr:NUDIX hydrolase [Chloroflexota bacterium]
MSTPLKQAVALVVWHTIASRRLLVVQRPADDPDLPGIWGLPAASLQPGEDSATAARRVGAEKLGIPVHLTGVLRQGSQERTGYRLSMALWEARLGFLTPRLPEPAAGLPGNTYYIAWRWAAPAALGEGARSGSLCCQLLLAALKKASNLS